MKSCKSMLIGKYVFKIKPHVQIGLGEKLVVNRTKP